MERVSFTPSPYTLLNFFLVTNVVVGISNQWEKIVLSLTFSVRFDMITSIDVHSKIEFYPSPFDLQLVSNPLASF